MAWLNGTKRWGTALAQRSGGGVGGGTLSSVVGNYTASDHYLCSLFELYNRCGVVIFVYILLSV